MKIISGVIGMGIGQKFCKELIDWIKKKDVFNWISLNTLRNNLSAYQCYNKLGFIEVKVQPHARFLNGSWQDLIIMRKKIWIFSLFLWVNTEAFKNFSTIMWCKITKIIKNLV